MKVQALLRIDDVDAPSSPNYWLVVVCLIRDKDDGKLYWVRDEEGEAHVTSNTTDIWDNPPPPLNQYPLLPFVLKRDRRYFFKIEYGEKDF